MKTKAKKHTGDTVKSLLMQHMASLTRAEKQLASTLLSNYPLSGMASITEIAETAGVSTPTVIRAARKLGFEGFSDLQKAMRAEVYATLEDPIKKHDALSHNTGDSHFVNQFADAVALNIRNTLARLNHETFDAVATLLSNPKKDIYLTGGRITSPIADYLFNHLQITRPKVTHLGTSANIWPQHVVDMNKESVVLIFDIRRYETDLAKLARLADDQGASVVLFTDQWGSPISDIAQHRFDALVEVPSPWDSSVAIMIIVEALIASIQEKDWKSSKQRIEKLETMFGKTKLFRRFSN